MKIQLSLRWIDNRIKIARKSKRPLLLTIRQRQLIWLPNFVTTFRKRISAEDFVQHSDFVALKLNQHNQTEVQVQIVLSWNEPCPKMNFKVWLFILKQSIKINFVKEKKDAGCSVKIIRPF